MNKNYTSIIVLVTILFFGVLSAQETQKNFINYQGVARNATNELMVGEAMTVTIGLKFGAGSAPVEYEENHSITTDSNGVFSLLIGNGSSTTGNYNALPWGSAATFVTVSMNGNEIGTTEMMAVPYAISAGSIKDPSADEVLYDNSTSGLTATTAQDAIDELVTGGSVDADADPSNEFQTLNFDAVTNELSLSDGNSVTIPSGGTDADADPENEIQTISFNSTTNELSLTDGGMVTIPSGGTDADADPTNEFQNLSFDAGTNQLSLSDGNSIVIPTGGVDGDGDSTNEIQTISFDAVTNELSLSDGGTVTIPSGGTDADADPTNEIQDISLAGTKLTISEGSTIDLAPIVPPGGTDDQNLTFNETTKVLEIEDGNTVDLSILASSGGSSTWDENEFGLHRRNGVVSIGNTAPSASSNSKFSVVSSAPGVRSGIRSYVFHPGFKVGISASALSRDDQNTFGMRSGVTSESTGPAWAYRADMNGAGTGTKYGLDLKIHDGTGGIKYGIHVDGEDKNYLSGSLGIGVEDPTVELDVDGSIRSRNLTGSGLRNVMANANGNLVVGTGGASSLWTANGSDINYEGGNVGIGIASPARPLHILGDEDNSIRFESATERNWVSYFNSSGYIGYSGIFTGSNDMDFGTALLNGTGKVHLTTNAIPKLTVVPNGNVGIGTTTPTAKLEVVGDIKTSGEVHSSDTGDSNMLAFAYGIIRGNGQIESGSENFTVIKIAAGEYQITITGEDYILWNYPTVVSSSQLGFVENGSVGGKLIINTYDVSGNPVDKIFNFVVFKP